MGKKGLAALLMLLCIAQVASAQDYLRLKNGKLIPGAIVRVDSAAVFLANWYERHQPLPRLQVYEKQEIESIWFRPPPRFDVRTEYRPRERGWEFGGGMTFQSMKLSDNSSRRMLQFSVLGGYTVLPLVGIEGEADFTFPHAEKTDSVWHPYHSAYQVSMNILFHPVQFKGTTPFFLIGGGTALDIPLNHSILTSSQDSRNLLNLGAGLKWGKGGLGFRLEYRYQFYSWTPDDFIPIYDAGGTRIGERRVDAHEAFCHLLRLGLFFYR